MGNRKIEFYRGYKIIRQEKENRFHIAKPSISFENMGINLNSIEDCKKVVDCSIESTVDKTRPYLIETEIKVVKKRRYNPDFGDDRMCTCGHAYYRHFDTYENMYPCGCKYCECVTFRESSQITEKA